jgi:site-specific DNA-methyltransferase (adenine-specific)
MAGKSLDDLLNTIFVGDCLEGMRQLPSMCVDLVFADPPYNLGKDFGNNLDHRPDHEYREWCAAWIQELHRLVKPSAAVYVCCDWFYSGLFQELLSQHFIIQNRITWKREKGRGAQRNWKNNMEDLWFCTASSDYKFYVERVKIKKEVIAPYRENGKPKDWVEENGERYRWTHPSNIWTDLVVPFWSMPENTPHPTQKPERLVERVLLASSDEGDLVLDPFMGSGTTAVVATRLKRSFIGFELNPDYVRLALKRLEREQSQPTLFYVGAEPSERIFAGRARVERSGSCENRSSHK